MTCLDEGVADPGADRRCRRARSPPRGRRDGDQVVDHRRRPGSRASSRAAISAVSALGDTTSPRLVDDEAAVGVAVEGQADVGAVLAARRPAGRAGSPARSGWPRGWGTCRRARSTAGRRSSGRPVEHRRDGEAGHAVAGVDDHRQRADARQVDEAAQVGGVVRRACRAAVHRARGPRSLGGGRRPGRGRGSPRGRCPGRPGRHRRGTA